MIDDTDRFPVGYGPGGMWSPTCGTLRSLPHVPPAPAVYEMKRDVGRERENRDGRHLHQRRLADRRAHPGRRFGARSDAGFGEVKRQLAEYFAGDRQRFELPIDARGDDFQRRVWELIDRIPYGRTATYGDLARDLGNPALARDVGAAVGRNPLCVIVPCHRVVGRDGKLTGYAGGLARKRLLLDLEELAADRSARLF